MKLSFKSAEGSRRLLALFIALILLFSFIATLISTDGGTIKISRINIDARGATIGGELYYPVNTSDRDSLPAVVIAHGAAVTRGVMRGLAEELARRGFVVLNVDAYGTGISEAPLYDEGGNGIDQYNATTAPCGYVDCIDFLRSLDFVDSTRIGMMGHSQGGRRAQNAAIEDAGFYNFNDIMINVLYETFGQRFTEAEIGQSADALAAARLNADQLAHYNSLKEAKFEIYDTRLRAIFLLGSQADIITPLRPVVVAGHEVLRNCQVSMGIDIGTHDLNYVGYRAKDVNRASWHTGDTEIEKAVWYTIDDVNDTSAVLGGFRQIAYASSQALRDAAQNRTARVWLINPETHSQNFFSAAMASDTVKYFEQTLGYNRGEMTGSNNALSDSSVIFFWRELFNFLAMLSMIGMLAALAAVLLNTVFFKPCIASGFEPKEPEKNDKLIYWAFAGVTAVLGYIGIYMANKSRNRPQLSFAKEWPSYSIAGYFLIVMGIAGLLLIIGHSVLNAKRYGKAGVINGLKSLGLAVGVKGILKTILLALVLLISAYGSLLVIQYLFNQDYRLWMAVFAEMRVEKWADMWMYVLYFLPMFLVVGAGTNYVIRSDMPQWKDTLVTVVVGSIGVWVCCAVNQILVLNVQGSLYSNFTSSYNMLILVPITVYITKKMYKLTNSIWLGALLNSLLVGWMVLSAIGASLTYQAQTFLGNLLGM